MQVVRSEEPRCRNGRRRLSRLGATAAALGALVVVGAPHAGAQTASSDAPATAVQVTTSYPAISVEPGTTVKLDLKTVAPVTERVDLAVDGAPVGWTTTLRGGGFVIAGVTAGPLDAATAQLEIAVPADAAPGQYPLTVDGTAADGQSTLAISITVAEVVDSGIQVAADFPSLRGGPTDTFSYTLTVDNKTPAAQTFNFSATGPDGWTVTASPQAESRANTVTVDAGGTAKVGVSATPPASVTEGTYPITVDVDGQNGAKGSIQLGAEVGGTAKLDLQTASGVLNAAGPSNSVHKESLTLSNSGSAPVTKVTLSASPPSGWTVTFDPPTVDNLAAGQTAQVVATIKPGKDAIAGDYAIGITASGGSVNSNVALRYTVNTSRSWGLVGLALILAAVAALVIGFRRFGRH